MTAAPGLEVLDHGQPVVIGYDDLVKYHGRASIGGVALGFKVMERAFPILDRGRPLERYEVGIMTAFAGPGARDAFEMVTRAVTGGRYEVDLTLGPDAPEAPEGRFSFRVTYRGRAVDLAIRPAVVPDEFIELVRRSPRTEAEEARLVDMKEDLAAKVMERPAVEVFTASMPPT